MLAEPGLLAELLRRRRGRAAHRSPLQLQRPAALLLARPRDRGRRGALYANLSGRTLPLPLIASSCPTSTSASAPESCDPEPRALVHRQDPRRPASVRRRHHAPNHPHRQPEGTPCLKHARPPYDPRSLAPNSRSARSASSPTCGARPRRTSRPNAPRSDAFLAPAPRPIRPANRPHRRRHVRVRRRSRRARAVAPPVATDRGGRDDRPRLQPARVPRRRRPDPAGLVRAFRQQPGERRRDRLADESPQRREPPDRDLRPGGSAQSGAPGPHERSLRAADARRAPTTRASR